MNELDINGMSQQLESALAMLQDIGIEYGVKIAGAIAILLVGKRIVKIVLALLEKALQVRHIDETLRKFAGSILNIVLQLVVYMAALGTLGIETTSLVAILGAAGLAVGMALKDTLGNFASGVMIILFRPFVVGNYIEAGGVSGTVHQVGIFNTTILTVDNKKIIVPNANITGGNIVNFSAEPTRRVDMVFGIGYDDDIKKAKDVLAEILKADGRILAEPEPLIAVSELADSSVNFAVRPWVNSADYWGVYFDTQEAVKLRFDAEGISIPYPQTDLHVHEVKPD